MNTYYVYITTNPRKNVLYTGVSNNLRQRMNQHYENKGKSETFAGKYYCYNLIYFEEFTDVKQAIEREKEIKMLRRELKENLIRQINPNWSFIKVD